MTTCVHVHAQTSEITDMQDLRMSQISPMIAARWLIHRKIKFSQNRCSIDFFEHVSKCGRHATVIRNTFIDKHC